MPSFTRAFTLSAASSGAPFSPDFSAEFSGSAPTALPIFGLASSVWPANPDAVPTWQQAVGFLGFNPTHFGFGWDTSRTASQWVAQVQSELSALQTLSGNLGLPRVKGLFGFPMADPINTSTSSPTCFQQITSGAWDLFYIQMFNAITASGQVAYVRPGFEMNLNGTQFQWQITTSSATWASGFKNAFIRIYQLAHNQITGQVPVNGTVVIAWCPSAAFPGTSSYRGPFADYYPGDNFVDAIGCDIYGLPIGGDSSYVNQTPNGTDITLTDLLNLCASSGKPFMLGEWGAGNDSLFPGLVANKVNASGVRISSVMNWDIDFGQGLQWSSYGSTVGNAWHDAVATIVPVRGT